MPNNLSTGFPANSRGNILTSLHHPTPRSMLNISVESDNTIDDEEACFSVPHSVPNSGRITTLNGL